MGLVAQPGRQLGRLSMPIRPRMADRSGRRNPEVLHLRRRKVPSAPWSMAGVRGEGGGMKEDKRFATPAVSYRKAHAMSGGCTECAARIAKVWPGTIARQWRMLGMPRLQGPCPAGQARQVAATTGPRHYRWAGASATGHAGRRRAQKLFPVIGKCAKCPSKAKDRHHIDGDTSNNDPSNIEFVCRRCHMAEDGRLERLRLMALARAAAARC